MGIYGTLKVMVSNDMVQAESISLSAGETKSGICGESVQLQYAILPENTTYKTVKWSTSDESVATVDENGLVTAQLIEIANGYHYSLGFRWIATLCK